VLHGDRLIVFNENQDDSYLAAFHKGTGEPQWRIKRDRGTSYATPFVWKNDKRIEVVTVGVGRVDSYDLDGKPLWNLRYSGKCPIPTPVSAHGWLYALCGHWDTAAFAVRPGASGDITPRDNAASAFVAWSDQPIMLYVCSPLVYGDYLYALGPRGELACRDAKTGKGVYNQKSLGKDAKAFTASPWAYDGKIFCLSHAGDTWVIEAGPNFKVLAKNSLGDICLATPAIAGESLIIRTDTTLYRIAEQASPKNPGMRPATPPATNQ
jgi:outer membrane protein assembly factor BamB